MGRAGKIDIYVMGKKWLIFRGKTEWFVSRATKELGKHITRFYRGEISFFFHGIPYFFLFFKHFDLFLRAGKKVDHQNRKSDDLFLRAGKK